MENFKKGDKVLLYKRYDEKEIKEPVICEVIEVIDNSVTLKYSHLFCFDVPISHIKKL